MKRTDGEFFIHSSVMIVLLALCFLNFFSTRQEAISILRREGYTDIELTGRGWNLCADDASLQLLFVGKKAGESVEGVVCSDATVRVFN